MGELEREPGRAHARLTLGIAACAVLIVVLSFLPWVEFQAGFDVQGDVVHYPGPILFSLDGTELSRLRGPDYDQPADIEGQEVNPCTCRVGFGDGYIVAGLGSALLAVAGAGLFLPLATRFTAMLSIAISLVAFLVSGYNATGDWIGVGAKTLDDIFVDLDGTVQPALWALLAVSALAAVLGAVMWSLERAAEREEDEYEYDEEQMDEHAPETEEQTQTSEGFERMAIRPAALIGFASAALIAGFSFLPWLDRISSGQYGVTSRGIRGDELEGVTSGDGMVTAIAGIVAAVSATILPWTSAAERFVGGIYLGVGLFVGAIVSYDLLDDRSYAPTMLPPGRIEFSPTAWLYLIGFASVALIVTGLRLLAPKPADQSTDDSTLPPMSERAEGWA